MNIEKSILINISDPLFSTDKDTKWQRCLPARLPRRVSGTNMKPSAGEIKIIQHLPGGSVAAVGEILIPTSTNISRILS